MARIDRVHIIVLPDEKTALRECNAPMQAFKAVHLLAGPSDPQEKLSLFCTEHHAGFEDCFNLLFRIAFLFSFADVFFKEVAVRTVAYTILARDAGAPYEADCGEADCVEYAPFYPFGHGGMQCFQVAVDTGRDGGMLVG